MTTVSHALSGARSVRPSTKEHVLELVEQLGYRADPLARGLRGQRSNVLGLVGDRVITTPHASAMVAGAQRAAAARGSFVAAVDSGDDPEIEALQIGEMTDHRVDGVLYARMGHRRVEIPAGLRGKPMVLLDASADDPGVSSIVPDEHEIGATALRHLVQHGHRRIALVTTREETLAVSGRWAGYRDELVRSGLEVDESLVVRAATATTEGGRQVARTLFDRSPRRQPSSASTTRWPWGSTRRRRVPARRAVRAPRVATAHRGRLPLRADALHRRGGAALRAVLGTWRR